MAAAPTAPLAARAADRVVPAPAPPGKRAASIAKALIGAPYRFGGSSPLTGFDCSGFVQYVYGELGLELPHYSVALWRLGRAVDTSSLAPGDIVFFDDAQHVGIYIGSGKFVHAPNSGSRVRIDEVSYSWYGATFDGARRLI